MADHTAPDYYEQVTKESQEKLAREDEKIYEGVEQCAVSHMASLKTALAREFGWASVRSAKLNDVEYILHDLAHAAAREAQNVMTDSHYQESRESTCTVVKAVLAGIQLAQPELDEA